MEYKFNGDIGIEFKWSQTGFLYLLKDSVRLSISRGSLKCPCCPTSQR